MHPPPENIILKNSFSKAQMRLSCFLISLGGIFSTDVTCIFKSAETCFVNFSEGKCSAIRKAVSEISGTETDFCNGRKYNKCHF